MGRMGTQWSHKRFRWQCDNSDLLGAGLCRFKVKKIKGSVSRKIAQLQEDEGGYFIDILIDEDFPMSEINEFWITNTMTERDEDGNRFTLFEGLYPYNASINGYRLPVLVNPL